MSPRIKDLPLATQVNTTDYIPLDQEAGTKKIPISTMATKVDLENYVQHQDGHLVIKGNLYPTHDGVKPNHFGPPTKDSGNVLMPYGRAIGGFTKDGSGVRTIGFVANDKAVLGDSYVGNDEGNDAVFFGTNVSNAYFYSKLKYPAVVSNGEMSSIATQDWVKEDVSGLHYFFKQPNPSDSNLLPQISAPETNYDVILTSQNITFTEGSTMTVQFRLTSKPLANVGVSVSSNNLINVNSNSFTFTPNDYNVYKTIEFSYPNDSQITSPITDTFTLSFNGGEYEGITKSIEVTVLDNSNPSILVDTPTLEISEGQSKVLNVKLNLAPTKDVVVSCVCGSGVSSTTSSLTFSNTNYNVYQSLSIDAIDNSDVGDIITKVSLSVNDGGFVNVVKEVVVTVLCNEGGNGGESSNLTLNELFDFPLSEANFSTLGTTYTTDEVNKKVVITNRGSNRPTLFMQPDLTKVVFDTSEYLTNWWTMYRNTDSSISYGIYMKNTGQFGFVKFKGFSEQGYTFTPQKPTTMTLNAGDKITLEYDNVLSQWKLTKNEGQFILIKKSDFDAVVEGEMIPCIGIKLDSGDPQSNFTASKVISATKGSPSKLSQNTSEQTEGDISSDYGYGVSEKLDRAIAHIKNLNSIVLGDYVPPTGGESTITNPFKGKKVSAIGDSITADGSYLTPLVSTLELSSSQNLGIGGQGYVGGTFLNQVSSIASDTSLIVMAGGINDFRVNKPLGTPSDMADTTTMYGALYLTFKKVAELHSDKKVVVALYHNNSEHVHTQYPAYDEANSVGNYGWEYIEAMKQRASMFGFPVADVYGESGINGIDHCTTDGIHLNATGGSRMAEVIKHKVLNTPYYRF